VARTAVIAGTATHVSNNVSRRQAGRWAEKEQQQAPPPQQAYAPPPAPAGLSMDDKLAQLKDLGALKEQGILSEAEFEVQKHAILNG
jgi:hypothetical protein